MLFETTQWTGMLYGIIITGAHPLDLLVPMGGVVMMVGWFMICAAIVREKVTSHSEKE